MLWEREERERIMNTNHKNQSRILKVEEIGDFYRRKTTPRIRLKGKWLAGAGINPNRYVSVENPQPGTLIIRMIDKTQ